MSGSNPAFSSVPSPSGQRPFRGDSAQKLVPLDAPTQYPDEDVRTGGAIAPESLYATDAMANSEDANRMRAALPYLSTLAELPQTSNAFRNYVRYLKSAL
jgi:spermidine/putrescine-binding protein